MQIKCFDFPLKKKKTKMNMGRVIEEKKGDPTAAELAEVSYIAQHKFIFSMLEFAAGFGLTELWLWKPRAQSRRMEATLREKGYGVKEVFCTPQNNSCGCYGAAFVSSVWVGDHGKPTEIISGKDVTSSSRNGQTVHWVISWRIE